MIWPNKQPTINLEDIPKYPPYAKGLPACDATQLCESQRDWLLQIREAIGFDAYATHVKPILLAYANYVLLLPASERHHHRGAGGLFRHGLEVGFYSLRSAKNKMFPTGNITSQRTIKEQEKRWHLAAFIGGLLHDVGKPLADLSVTDEKGRNQWNPHLQSLAEWLSEHKLPRYFVHYRGNRAHKQHEKHSMLMVDRMIPHATRVHLAAVDPNIISDLLCAVSGESDSIIGGIVMDADRMSVSLDLGSQISVDDSLSVPTDKYLMDGLRQLYKERWKHIFGKTNCPVIRVVGHEDKLVLNWLAVASQLTDYIREQKIPGVPQDPDRMMIELADVGALEFHGPSDSPVYYFDLSFSNPGQGNLRWPKAVMLSRASNIHSDLPTPVAAEIHSLKPKSNPDQQSTTQLASQVKPDTEQARDSSTPNTQQNQPQKMGLVRRLLTGWTQRAQTSAESPVTPAPIPVAVQSLISAPPESHPDPEQSSAEILSPSTIHIPVEPKETVIPTVGDSITESLTDLSTPETGTTASPEMSRAKTDAQRAVMSTPSELPSDDDKPDDEPTLINALNLGLDALDDPFASLGASPEPNKVENALGDADPAASNPAQATGLKPGSSEAIFSVSVKDTTATDDAAKPETKPAPKETKPAPVAKARNEVTGEASKKVEPTEVKSNTEPKDAAKAALSVPARPKKASTLKGLLAQNKPKNASSISTDWMEPTGKITDQKTPTATVTDHGEFLGQLDALLPDNRHTPTRVTKLPITSQHPDNYGQPPSESTPQSDTIPKVVWSLLQDIREHRAVLGQSIVRCQDKTLIITKEACDSLTSAQLNDIKSVATELKEPVHGYFGYRFLDQFQPGLQAKLAQILEDRKKDLEDPERAKELKMQRKKLQKQKMRQSSLLQGAPKDGPKGISLILPETNITNKQPRIAHMIANLQELEERAQRLDEEQHRLRVRKPSASDEEPNETNDLDEPQAADEPTPSFNLPSDKDPAGIGQSNNKPAIKKLIAWLESEFDKPTSWVLGAVTQNDECKTSDRQALQRVKALYPTIDQSQISILIRMSGSKLLINKENIEKKLGN